MKILQLIISVLVFIAVATLVLVHLPRIHGFGWAACIALLGALAWLVKASYDELTEKD